METDALVPSDRRAPAWGETRSAMRYARRPDRPRCGSSRQLQPHALHTNRERTGTPGQPADEGTPSSLWANRRSSSAASSGSCNETPMSSGGRLCINRDTKAKRSASGSCMAASRTAWRSVCMAALSAKCFRRFYLPNRSGAARLPHRHSNTAGRAGKAIGPTHPISMVATLVPTRTSSKLGQRNPHPNQELQHSTKG